MAFGLDGFKKKQTQGFDGSMVTALTQSQRLASFHLHRPWALLTISADPHSFELFRLWIHCEGRKMSGYGVVILGTMGRPPKRRAKTPHHHYKDRIRGCGTQGRGK